MLLSRYPDEKQFLLGEGFQQRRGKHDVHATIFRLETGSIELRRRIRIKLKPAFKNGGTVTAGNSSQTSDGASFVLVMSEKLVNQLNLKPKHAC